MSVFTGTWLDQNQTSITITENGNFLSVAYGNGRGPFNGFSLGASAPVIDVNYTDVGVQNAGVYIAGNQSIFWSDNSQWVKSS